MPRRHKPSPWQALPYKFDSQIQDEVKKCYPPEVMENIIKAACLEKIQPDPAKRAEIAKAIENSIIYLGIDTKNWQNLPNRPTPSQREAALRKVEKATHTLNEILKTLDSDSSYDLRWAMLSDSFSDRALGIEQESADYPFRGIAKFQTLLDITNKLEQWAATAQERTKEKKDGNKPADVKRWFAERITKIWIMIGYEKPTITTRTDNSKTTGPLMEFTNAAAGPLGLLPMEAALKEEIKLWREKRH
jgi:hypothetical protein